ncbi:MAG: hypothetical protein ABEH40_09270 [Haloferacaceae archaeon]
MRSGRRADRAVSTAFGYVLLLTVATLLVSGLLLATGSFVDGQRDRATREGLSVAGQQTAGAIETADRLVDSGESDPSTLVVEQRLPRRVAGSGYVIEVNDTGGDAELELVPSGASDEADRTVTVPLSNRTAVAETSIQGGPIEVVYTGSRLEVRSDV